MKSRLLKPRIMQLLDPLGPLKTLTLSYETLLSQEHERRNTGNKITWDAKTVPGYVAFRMMPRVAVVQRAMNDVLRAGWKPPDKENVVALDLGAGPGTASWGAWCAFDGSLNSFETTFVEPSLPMLNASNSLVGDSFKTNWAKSLVELARGLKTRAGAARYDLVMATYTLSDLDTVDARDVAVSMLWDLVKVGGCLLVLESGSKEGAFVTSRARSLLLSLRRNSPSPSVDDDDELILASTRAHHVVSKMLQGDASTITQPRIIAPCGHSGACPLLLKRGQRKKEKYDHGGEDDNDDGEGEMLLADEEELHDEEMRAQRSARLNSRPWCHFLQRTERLLVPITSRGTKASNDHVVSFSYFAAEKELMDGSQVPEYSRILRSPLKQPGRVYLDVCRSSGVERVLLSKRQGEIYATARKMKWGDVW